MSEEIYDFSQKEKVGISWRDRLIDLSKNYPEPEFLFEFDSKKFFSMGDIIVIKGKPKKGKSHFMIAFCVALIKGDFIGITAYKSGISILYVDCEMHANYTAALTKKIHFASGLNVNINNAELSVLNLKTDTPTERERIIEDAIRDLKPSVVLIDGVKDITRTEPNDQAEGKRIGEQLKRWTGEYNCIVGIAIHENKNDFNSRGAVGAAVEEIASEVWRIDRDIEGVFTAEQTAFRYHSPIENLCFEMDEHGNIFSAEPKPKVDKEELKLQKIQFIFREVFTKYPKLSFTTLQDEYMRIKGVGTTAAYNAIMEAVKKQVIIKNLIGDYELFT